MKCGICEEIVNELKNGMNSSKWIIIDKRRYWVYYMMEEGQKMNYRKDWEREGLVIDWYISGDKEI